jgi:pyruvate formate lyase activating enzyme
MSIFAKEAPIYNKLSESRVQCGICPRSCILSLNQRGYCGLYINDHGKLFIEQYGAVISAFPTAYSNFFFHPGRNFLSVQLPGCNSGCKFCWYGINYTCKKVKNVKPYYKRTPFVIGVNQVETSELSSAPYEIPLPQSYRRVSSSQIVDIMHQSGCHGLHFGVAECSISLSWVLEASEVCHNAGGENILSTNGYLSQETIRLLSQNIDSVRLSFKASGNKQFYQKQTTMNSERIFETAKAFKENGVFLQVISGVKVGSPLDDFRQWARWVVENLGSDTPSAVNPYFPIDFGVAEAEEYYVCIEQITKEEGLRFFHMDRPITFGDTAFWICPDCKKPILTEEFVFSTADSLGVESFENSNVPLVTEKVELNVDLEGKCLSCGCQTPIKP